MRTLTILFLISISLTGTTFSQTAEDVWGIWYMYFGTLRVHDDWSIHTELQHRNYEVPGNFNQLLTRVGINRHLESGGILTTGVGYIRTVPFEEDPDNWGSREFRIWQELRLSNRLGRIRVGHRYRFEERWVNTPDGRNFSTRARYRVIFTLPLNTKDIEPGTFSLAAYDEIFINISNNPFSQNRLYGALGYQISKPLGIQLGYLYNRLGPQNLNRLQIGFFWNPDFRE